jgi:hypothetical protein
VHRPARAGGRAVIAHAGITNTTVRDSIRDGSAAVTDRGEQELKGIDANWRPHEGSTWSTGPNSPLG